MSTIAVAANVTVERSTPRDHGELFTLQRAAFVDEARLYETPFVPALDETFADFEERLRASESWVARSSGRIVGAVSLRSGSSIERLMVAPDRRGEDIAKLLLNAVERHAASNGRDQLQLIVGDLALENREIYRHLGWVEQGSHLLDGFENVLLYTMTKRLVARSS